MAVWKLENASISVKISYAHYSQYTLSASKQDLFCEDYTCCRAVKMSIGDSTRK